MIIELKVPEIGESINEVTIASLLVEEGEYVEMDQSICEFDTDKATLEFPAEKAGTISWVAGEGDDLAIGDVVAKLDTSAKAPAKKEVKEVKEAPKAAPAAAKSAKEEKPVAKAAKSSEPATYATGHPSPAAKKMMDENSLSAGQVSGTGKDGRITKADVIRAIEGGASAQGIVAASQRFSRNETTKKMSRLRKTVSKRLVAVKNETAMLTTFNEVDMGPIMEIRKKYKQKFQDTHDGTRLGFMSFFIKACCNALLEFPAINAYLNDDEGQVIYHDYCDISIAVSTPKGLVVPVIRNAESLSMAGIENEVRRLALKGRDGELGLKEMEGGTFTLTNGGVFGSLMSTPIINSPQSAILGMHKIQERPMAIDGKVVVRPMMYLALSYDHRIVDGKESVSYLVKVKEQLENPEHLLFGSNPVELLLGL